MKTNRRGFLGLGAMAAAAAGTRLRADPPAPERENGTVKFCAFADIHYRPGPKGFPHSTKKWLDTILDRAVKENCDFVIHCGDFCHNPKAEKDYVDHYNNFRLPAYHTIGNHDDDGCTHNETLKAYGLEKGYYFFDRNGFRFIVIDANYIRWADGSTEHYSRGNYFKRNKNEKCKDLYAKGLRDTLAVVPPEEVAWLEETIASSPHPCVCFSHQSFERLFDGACANAAEIRAVFDRANAKVPGKVRLVINGHHHCDHLRILENIVYLDLNSASYQWIGEKHAHQNYPDSFFAANGQQPRKVPWVSWDDPLNAIITMTAGGGIKIEGMRSKFSCGVTPQMCAGYRDLSGRPTTPFVQSADLRLAYS